MKLNTEKELRALYGFAKGRSVLKELSAFEQHTIRYVELSPFVVISSVGHNGDLDSSPRGGVPGFAKVLDKKTLLLPDSKGNNRLDSLVNIIETAKLGCLFMIPGVNETLRVNGHASITTRDDYLELFSGEKNPPKTVIEVKVTSLYLHCAKAFMRSKLWSADAITDRHKLPTMSQMINDQTEGDSVIENQQMMEQRYEKDL
jgi:PPOX class probable FMN-dependent enzyme